MTAVWLHEKGAKPNSSPLGSFRKESKRAVEPADTPRAVLMELHGLSQCRLGRGKKEAALLTALAE